MATTSPNNISYPTNADAQKTIEQRIQDTASSVQTALDTKANLAGAVFTGNVEVSASGTYINGSNGTATFATSSSGKVPLVAKGTSGQTANIQEWQDSSGTVVSNVDSVGRKRSSVQPYFFAKGAETNYTLTNGADVPFNTVIYNIGSHYNSTNYRFTAPVAGVYQISISFFCNGGSGRMSMKVNGGAYNNMQTQWNSTGNWSYSAAIYLNANDYVTVGDWQGLSGATPYMGHSNFSGYLLG